MIIRDAVAGIDAGMGSLAEQFIKVRTILCDLRSAKYGVTAEVTLLIELLDLLLRQALRIRIDGGIKRHVLLQVDWLRVVHGAVGLITTESGHGPCRDSTWPSTNTPCG